MGIFPGGADIKEVFAGAPIKEVYAGSQLVWSSGPSWPQGFIVGPTSTSGQWRPSANTWTSATTSGVSAVSPHPSYPDSLVEGAGIPVVAGSYTVTIRAYHAFGSSFVKGVRATLNGAAIPGLTRQVTTTSSDITMTATVPISTGTIGLQVYQSNGSAYISTGKNGVGDPYTFLIIEPAS